MEHDDDDDDTDDGSGGGGSPGLAKQRLSSHHLYSNRISLKLSR